MRLPLNQRVLINTIAKRQQRIEKELHKQKQLIIEANNKKKEQEQLADALKNEIPAYEKVGLYTLVSLNQQKRKQAIILSSLATCIAQVKEIELKLEKLKEGITELQRQRQVVIKKQNKMTLYFERKFLQKTLYLERLE